MSDLNESDAEELERRRKRDEFNSHMEAYLIEQGVPVGQTRQVFRAMVWSGQVIMTAHALMTKIVGVGLVIAFGLFVTLTTIQQMGKQ